MQKAKTLKQIESLMEQASNLAIKLIESEARKILKQHPNLDTFIMAMGSAFFNDNNGPVYELKYLNKFEEMVNDLNNDLNICGYPMMFTVDSEVQNDW